MISSATFHVITTELVVGSFALLILSFCLLPTISIFFIIINIIKNNYDVTLFNISGGFHFFGYINLLFLFIFGGHSSINQLI